jgi:flagellar hook-basal body protein
MTENARVFNHLLSMCSTPSSISSQTIMKPPKRKLNFHPIGELFSDSKLSASFLSKSEYKRIVDETMVQFQELSVAVDGIDVNFSYLTRFESNGKSTVKAVRGAADSTGGGRSMGKLNDVSIDETGKLYGVYTNGETKLLGQISVATFANPMALEALGNSVYTTTQNSGYFDGIGTSVDEDGGKISQGVLEMSNVDLSAEFTDMITTQRGFQANSRIITTSDSMLEELVNLKR